MHKKKAFTLLELLIVVAFIGIMSSVVIVSLSASRIQKQVEGTSREVSAAIREAQNGALTGKKTDDTHLPCDYKFNYVNSTTYTISYDYHTVANPSCTNTQVLATYTTKNSVIFPSSFNTIIFQAPFSSISGLSSDPMPIVVNKGSVNYVVCVSSSGNIWEKANSTTCP